MAHDHLERIARWLLAVVAALGAVACAGGTPLLHPAHTLPAGKTRFAAGLSGNFASGNAASAIDSAQAQQPTGAVDRPPPAYVRGALAVAAFAPGVVPFVSGRVGLGSDAEAGLTYTGHVLRIDGRYAISGEHTALSFGIGGSALMSRRGGVAVSQLGGLDLQGVSGWGADIPIVFGWRSSGDVLWWWGGVRGAYESLHGDVGLVLPSPQDAVSGSLEARRTMAGALTGFAIGFRHLHAAVEFQGAWHDASGTLWGTDAKVTGLTWTPAAALLGTF